MRLCNNNNIDGGVSGHISSKLENAREFGAPRRGALVTWPDFDVPPPLRPVGGAGGDRRGGAGAGRGDAEAEAEEQGKQSERAGGPVHVDAASEASARVALCGRACGLNRCWRVALLTLLSHGDFAVLPAKIPSVACSSCLRDL